MKATRRSGWSATENLQNAEFQKQYRSTSKYPCTAVSGAGLARSDTGVLRACRDATATTAMRSENVALYG
eukprot:6191718-Pleurochrysis_carterae.AAC.6